MSTVGLAGLYGGHVRPKNQAGFAERNKLSGSVSAPSASLAGMAWILCRWRPQLPRRKSGVRSLVKFGASLTLGNCGYALLASADTLLLARFYGASAVGFYSRAVILLRRPLEQILFPINAVLIPALSRANPHPERFRRIFFAVYEPIVLLSFILSGLVLPLAKPITLVVLGPAWKETAPILGAFAMFALYYPLSHICVWLFESQGRGADALKTSGIVSMIGVAAILIGLPHGPVGVAVAVSAAGMLLQLPVFFFMVGRGGEIRTKDLWSGFFRQLPIWWVVFATTLVMQFWLGGQRPFVQLMVCATSGLLAGAASIWLYAPARRVAFRSITAVSEARHIVPTA